MRFMLKSGARMLLLAIAIGLGLAGVASAQSSTSYPVNRVQFIVPFGAGGATDTLARVVGQRLSTQLGKIVVIENRPGGNGNIGTTALAKASPDGQTIGMGAQSTLAINPAIYKSLAFDPDSDLVAIASLVSMPIVLVVNPSIEVSTVDELIKLMKRETRSFSYGSPGVGNTSHLFGELFKRSVGVEMIHVPYRSGPAVTTDLRAGHIQLAFSNILEALPHIKAGSVRALAIASSQRLKTLPDVPTLEELGIKGFASPAWFGVLAPRGMSPDIVNTLSSEITRALVDPDVVATLDRLSANPMIMGPQEFDAFIRSERKKWGKLARQVGVRAD